MPIFNRDYYDSLPLYETFKRNESGYLEGRPVVTCVGVFPYLQADGSILHELRLPEEVFSAESINSLRLKPVTNDHPDQMVTSENAKDLAVGSTGEDVSRFDKEGGYSFGYKTDGVQLSIPMVITNADAIEAVLNGKRGLSCGYTCELEQKSGVWGGIQYDCIQRNIRYNHVAIVDKGRAGDAAQIHMDGAFVPTATIGQLKKDESRGGNMKSYILDGITFEIDEAIEARIKSLEGEIINQKTTITSLTGARDVLDQKAKNLEEAMKGMIRSDELPKLVAERLEVKNVADRFKVSVDDSMSTVDMKKAILKVAVPSMKDSIDNKDAAYVDAAFAVCSTMEAPKKSEEHIDDKADEPAPLNDRLVAMWQNK